MFSPKILGSKVGNVQDQMNSLELCKKLIFGSLDRRVATWFSRSRLSQGGLASRSHDTPATRLTKRTTRPTMQHDTARVRATERPGHDRAVATEVQRFKKNKQINYFYFCCVFGTLRLDDASLN